MPVPGPGLFPDFALPPGVTPFTDGLLTSFTSWLAQDKNGHLEAFLTALGAMFDPTYSLVYDQGSPDVPGTYIAGWSSLLDPDNCPGQLLPYCAQFVGVDLPPGTDTTDARQIIKAEAGQKRGTPAAIISAAQRYLIGTQSVVLLERVPNAYSFTLVIRPEEDINQTALMAAVDAVRPAGITWTLIQTDGWSLFQMESLYASITALEAAFTTLNGLESEEVGH